MEILQQQQWPHIDYNNKIDNKNSDNTYEDRIAPSIYPNNTLIVDLNKCHNNITRFWSHPRSTTKGRYQFYMPESLLRTDIKLTSHDYDKALCVLTSDIRYQLHLLLYRKVQIIWLLLSSLLVPFILITCTSMQREHLVLACTALLWIGFQLIGFIITNKFRKKLDEMLEKSIAQVNTFFMEHNLMVGVINLGGLLSKSKLRVPLLYFDTSECRKQIDSIISIDLRRKDLQQSVSQQP